MHRSPLETLGIGHNLFLIENIVNVCEHLAFELGKQFMASKITQIEQNYHFQQAQ